MRGLERLSVRLVALLAVSALVPGLRAGTATNLHTSNEITIIVNKKHPAPSSSSSNSETNDSSATLQDTSESVKYKLTETKEDLAEKNVSRSVNRRFPQAVLFGGTCGGTIISPTWILTAGHCTLFTTGRQVLAGTSNSGDGSGVRRHVKRLVLHPKFSVGPYWLDADTFHIQQVAANWDFLLAELEEPLPLDGSTMAAAVLNEQPSVPAGLPVGYAGYGAEHHGEVMRNEMHGMELLVLPDATCGDALPQFDARNMLCTRGRPPRNDSACNGDSGSGLVADGKLYGVASWVEGDSHRCFNGALVVFSRVSVARDWIRQVTSV